MSEPRNAREQLAHDLKFLREAAGLSERQLAERIGGGANQTWVQRQEAGKGTTARSLRPQRIEAWARVTGADIHTQVRLRVLLESILRGDQSWRERLGDRAHLQEEMRAREATAHTVRNFQPTVIPGLLQTPEYARFVIRLADVEGVVDHSAALASRLQRQEILFTGEKRFEFLLGEAALHWPASQPEMLAAQLDRIVTLSSLKSVSVAVLPLGEPVNVIPWSNFVIFDGDAPFVSIELSHREDPIADFGRAEFYRQLYSKMRDRALVGADAVALIQRIATGLRAD